MRRIRLAYRCSALTKLRRNLHLLFQSMAPRYENPKLTSSTNPRNPRNPRKIFDPKIFLATFQFFSKLHLLTVLLLSLLLVSDIGSFPLGCFLLHESAVENLAPSLFAQISSGCFHNLQRDAISGMTAEQVRALPSALVSAWSATMVALSTEAVGALSWDQIKTMSPNTIPVLTPYVQYVEKCTTKHSNF